MKNGSGKYFYLDKGQLYEGVWVNDIPKCGTVQDFGREGAPEPTQYPIPEVRHISNNPRNTSPSNERVLSLCNEP